MSSDDEKVPESPKPMAFTIDFGGGKSVDSQRHKTLVEKYQKKHRRGQSLSKLEDTAIAKKQLPHSAVLPRKTSTEGYSSADEKKKCDKTRLSLPLQNANSDKMTQSCTLPSFNLTKIHRQLSSPECESQPEPEFDFDKSDTVSETGTYTLDGDNYSEEQKARMSIDRDFKIEEVSVFRKTQEYIESLQTEKLSSLHKNKLSPILSPTQNFSIVQNAEPDVVNTDKSFTKIMFPSPKPRIGIGSEMDTDQGSVISVTSSGAFRVKPHNAHRRRLSLTKSEVQVEAYTDNTCIVKPPNISANLSANLVLVSENIPNKVLNLPPPVGGKNSPTKIPSPIHRNRNCSNSLNIDLSDSSLETESYLKPTQNLLNSLQERLTLESDDSEPDNKYLNNDARNLLKKPTHLRHNSLDDRNLKMNKLEHFQNKNFIDQTYTNVLNQYSHKSMHKIQNSPNNSPIRRSSSFSTKNQINTKCNIPQKETNLKNSPNFIQRSSSTASMKQTIPRRFSICDSESSSEDDLKHPKKKDITNTRYNRAFSLRRARLDTEPPPKCPNTPEMRRKFLPERAISVDRKVIKTPEVQSRYLQNIMKTRAAAKVEVPKNSPKIGNVATKPAPKAPVFSRTDTGRFSMRSNTNKPPPVTNSQKTIRQNLPSKKQSGPRSNSSLTSKEVDFQNWKRRKSYDPMKAAAEGKRKAELAKKQNTMTQSYHEGNQDCDSSPSHSSSVHRSQSFHGTAALEHYISSEEEEDLTLSADEGFSPPTPSPCDLSPRRLNLRYAWNEQVLKH